MYKIGQDLEFDFGNVQSQPCKFELLESGNDSVNINVCESNSSSEQDAITISTMKESATRLVSRSEYVENCCSVFSNKLVTVAHLILTVFWGNFNPIQ